jgi:type VI secretion system protein ImpM
MINIDELFSDITDEKSEIKQNKILEKPSSISMQNCGYYGKVPTHGDFVHTNLPMSFIKSWDQWLQSILYESRTTFGERWHDYYLTAPIIEYFLSPNICGEKAWLGVLMPSVDRIGRYFPLTICQSVNPQQIAHPLLFETHRAWFDYATQLVLRCLDDDFQLTKLQVDLPILAKLIADNREKQAIKNSNIKTYQNTAWRIPLTNSSPDYLTLYAQILQKDAYSLWRNTGSNDIQESLVIAQGLPPSKSMLAMLNGDWSSNGWQ